MNGKIRLNKYIAERGVSSRRKADSLILEGRVKLNGDIVKSLGVTIDPALDTVQVNGQNLLGERQKFTYIILNKPKGVTSTLSDPHAEKTVKSLVASDTRVFPVGRLDKDSRGLLLMTNDGELAYRITHPKYSIQKKYLVRIKGKIKARLLLQMKSGVQLDEGLVSVDDVRVVEEGAYDTVLEMLLSEGKKREIRRICAALHLFLIDLQRVAIGPLSLGNLKEGRQRNLTEKELFELKSSVNLDNINVQ